MRYTTRRLLLVTGLASAYSGCAYGPDYGYGYGSSYPPYGYGYGSSYPSYGYGYGADYGYAYPSFGDSAPFYGYAPGPSFNFGFFGGGGHDQHWDGNHHYYGGGGQPYHWSGSDGHHDFHGNDFRGAQARAAPPPTPRVSAPTPHFVGTPRIPPGGNAGRNYGGPDGGPSH